MNNTRDLRFDGRHLWDTKYSYLMIITMFKTMVSTFTINTYSDVFADAQKHFMSFLNMNSVESRVRHIVPHKIVILSLSVLSTLLQVSCSIQCFFGHIYEHIPLFLSVNY